MTGVVRSVAGLDEDYDDVAGRLVGQQSKGAVGLELCHQVFGDKSSETGRLARQVVVVECRIGSEVLKKLPSSGRFKEAPESREVAEARVRHWSRDTEMGKVALEHCPSDYRGVARIRAPVLRKRANQVSPLTLRWIVPKEIPRQGGTSPRTSPPRITMPVGAPVA